MAWNEIGNLRGPQGLQGLQGPQGPPGVLPTSEHNDVFGGGRSRIPHGTLAWSGPWYNPPAGFSRLRGLSGAKLVSRRDTGGCTSLSGDAPCLIAPVNGVYVLSYTQTFGTHAGGKGIGLSSNLNNGILGFQLWIDAPLGHFLTVTATRALTAGTRLYPWVWVERGDAGMSGVDRDYASEMQLTYLAGGGV